MNKKEYNHLLHEQLSKLKEVDFLNLMYEDVRHMYTFRINPVDDATRHISAEDLSKFVSNITDKYKDLHGYNQFLLNKLDVSQERNFKLETAVLKMTEYFYRNDDINIKEFDAMTKYQALLNNSFDDVVNSPLKKKV